jgi:hypothetical protein
VKFGGIWRNLVKFGEIWKDLGKFGENLGKSGEM